MTKQTSKAKEEKEKRMAQALRDNLFKRKAQARKRSAPTDAKPLDDAQKTDEA